MELWGRRYDTKRYEFIKYINYDNRYYEADQLDNSIYYKVMVVNDNQCVLYIELDKPKIRRKL